MSLLKRHVGRRRQTGRRVVGVGVGAALLLLGLEAPAFAVPTITAISPTSGPDNCVVVITGTGFTDFPQAQQTLTFVGPVAGAGDDVPVLAANWTRISGTEIWARVPNLAEGTNYNISLADPSGTATSTVTFLSTTGGGGCAPTITSFAPTCGLAGTTVVITGTNLIGPNLLGAQVRFNPYAANATHTVPDVDTPTSLSVIVPAGAGDGPIRVTTFGAATGGEVFSVAPFEVPPPDCVTEPPTGDTHERSVRLTLKRHLIARGKVTVADEFIECAQNVPVKIQRRRSGGWRTVKVTTTSVTGSFKKRLPDRPGAYRAVARKITLPESGDVCLKDVSNRARHRH